MSGAIGEAFIRLRADSKGFKRDVEGGVTGAFSRVAKIVGGAFAAEKAFEFGKGAVLSAASVQKSLEVVRQQFGLAAQDVVKFGETTAAQFGLSEQASLDASARFGILFQNIGIGKDRAAEMTVGFQNLGGALSAIRGVDPTDVMQKLTLAAAGNTRGLKQLGIALSDAQVKQEALKLGLISSVKDALTPAAKAQAIYTLATQNLPHWLDLAAKHSGDFANVQRRLSAEWSNAKDQLGTALLPVLTRFGNWVSGHIPQIKAFLTDAFDAIASGAQKAGTFVSQHWGQIRDAILNAWQRVQPALSAIRDFFGTEIGKQVGKGLAAFVVFKAAFGGMVTAVVRGIGTITALARTNPWLALAAGVATAVALVITHWQPVKAFFIDLWRDIQVVFDKAALSVAEPFSHLPGALGQWARNAKDTLQTEIAKIRVDQAISNLEKQLADAGTKAGTAHQIAFMAAMVHGQPEIKRTALTTAQAVADATKQGLAPTPRDVAHVFAAVSEVIFDRKRELATNSAAVFAAARQAGVAALAPVREEAARTMDRASSAIRGKQASFAQAGNAAGGAVVTAIGAALAPLPGRVSTSVQAAATAARGKAGEFAGAGDVLGAALGSALASQIRAYAASAAAAISYVLASAKSVANALLGNPHSPSPVWEEDVGRPMGEGIVVGFEQAAGPLPGKVAFWLRYAGQEAIRAWLEGSANLPAKVGERFTAAIEAGRTAIEASRTRLTTAFGDLQNDALAAFDGINAAIKTKSEALLATMQKQDAARAMAKQLADAATAFQQAQTGVQDFQAGITPEQQAQAVFAAGQTPEQQAAATFAVGTHEGMTPEEVAAKQEELNQAVLAKKDELDAAVLAKQTEVNSTYATAQETFRQAERTKEEADLAAKAEQERKQLDARNILRRRHFDAALLALQAHLAKEGATHAQAQTAIVALLNKYGVNYKSAGLALGTAFGKGLKESEAATVKQAESLGAAVAKALAATLKVQVSITPGNEAATQAAR